jgi:hypothetical protein
MDDMGSVSEGEKEVYYLKSIETKSHVAIFTTSPRSDGLDATFPVDPELKENEGAKGENKPERLDKIDLYSKKDVILVNGEWEPKDEAKPVKTVHFSYDETYPLCANALNSVTGKGKLTLKKVWFEYNGIASEKISPYEFEYEYPYQRPNFNYPAEYKYLRDEYVNVADQNPDYSSFNLDPWGNYQSNGESRFDNMMPWINQNPQQTKLSDFDPAAWQLKVIKLPTGGEIHVQYEQDDYKYVQDKRAHIMMKAAYATPEHKSFVIDPAEIGITDTKDIDELAKIISEIYLNGGNTHDKKMYFKFFYKLLGSGDPGLNDCNTDFITGYALVTGVSIESGKILISFDAKNLPDYTCRDFVLTQRAGKLNPLGNCDPSLTGLRNPHSAASIVNNLVGFAATLSFPGGVCQRLSDEYSYLRIPVLKAKKGGGLRVKRLLMYDNNHGSPVLYGNEYIYKLEDNTSSGVATNEPGRNREENILVDYIKRGDQNVFSKIIAGRDKKQTEGPLGESVLPAPSVGYSKVYVRNIHSGKTGTGFSIKEYYTAKDLPFEVRCSEISTRNDYMLYPLLILNDFVNNLWATQGFSFIKNEMHGQPKRDFGFSGQLNIDLTHPGAALVSEQAYDYFRPGEQIPVSTSYGNAVRYMNCGKEVDLTIANKTVKDNNDDINVETDLTMGIWAIIPTPFFGACPSYTRSEMELSTCAVTKVITYPPVIKKVTTFNDGVYHTVENIAFDENTGKPVTTKSYDEFTGTYLIQNIPGAWEYENLQQKAKNEGRSYRNQFTYSKEGTNEYISISDNACNLKNELIPGDLVDLGSGNYYHIESYDDLNFRFKIIKSKLTSVMAHAIVKPTIKKLVIVRSGRSNRLNENIGSFTLHSTNENISLPEDGVTRWDANNDFAKALSSKLGSAGQEPILLEGTFSNMNVESLISEIPAECHANLGNATIRNIKLLNRKTDVIQLKIISFEMLCGDNWITIKAEE